MSVDQDQKDKGFHTTRWSLVTSVADADRDVAREALESLCSIYWEPLYGFLRRGGKAPDDAADLVQAFLLKVLERGDLERIAPEGGRFRSWLLKALSRFVINADRAARAIKRGGTVPCVPMEEMGEAEERYSREPADERWTPERLFLRRWGSCVLDQAAHRLAEECQGRERLFEHLRPHLAGATAETYEQIGDALGIAAGTVKVTAHRWRRRFRELVREEVAATVRDDEDVDAELALLLEALQAPPRKSPGNG